jgi:uncharacterized protein (DUF2235 family)
MLLSLSRRCGGEPEGDRYRSVAKKTSSQLVRSGDHSRAGADMAMAWIKSGEPAGNEDTDLVYETRLCRSAVRVAGRVQ